MKLNKKGFTLVEIIAVVALLGLLIGIAAPNVLKSKRKANEKLLSTKVKNIEKTAVLWGQDNKNLLTEDCSGKVPEDSSGCYVIQVGVLISNGYMDGDDDSKEVKNPVNNKEMNECYIYVYKKYGKVHAIYDKENDVEKCWVVK